MNVDIEKLEALKELLDDYIVSKKLVVQYSSRVTTLEIALRPFANAGELLTDGNFDLGYFEDGEFVRMYTDDNSLDHLRGTNLVNAFHVLEGHNG